MKFSELEDEIDLNVCYIPQKPNNVLHWKLSSLIPNESCYLEAMFDEGIALAGFKNRYLSGFSGGQIARVLVASAIHRLEASGSTGNYLLLDEAFEGLDVDLLSSVLKRLALQWLSRQPGRPLFLLLITHVDVEDVLKSIDRTAISVNRVMLHKHPSEFHPTQGEIIRVDLTNRNA